jgi:hypothetical protein
VRKKIKKRGERRGNKINMRERKRKNGTYT